jgi:hypothetical protein
MRSVECAVFRGLFLLINKLQPFPFLDNVPASSEALQLRMAYWQPCKKKSEPQIDADLWISQITISIICESSVIHGPDRGEP